MEKFVKRVNQVYKLNDCFNNNKKIKNKLKKMGVNIIELIENIINNEQQSNSVLVSKEKYENLQNRYDELELKLANTIAFYKKDICEKQELEKDLEYVIGMLSGLENEVTKLSCENEGLTISVVNLIEELSESNKMLLDILKKIYNKNRELQF